MRRSSGNAAWYKYSLELNVFSSERREILCLVLWTLLYTLVLADTNISILHCKTHAGREK